MLETDVLEAAGFIANKTYRETRFITSPKTTFCVYNVSERRQGGDRRGRTMLRSASIELYEYSPDPSAVAKLEAALDDIYPKTVDGWEKHERYWIESEQFYQTVYEFDYITKE